MHERVRCAAITEIAISRKKLFPSDQRQPETEEGTSDAMTVWELKDTSSRLPDDLGRTLRCACRAALWSYDSCASSGRACFVSTDIKRNETKIKNRADNNLMGKNVWLRIMITFRLLLLRYYLIP